MNEAPTFEEYASAIRGVVGSPAVGPSVGIAAAKACVIVRIDCGGGVDVLERKVKKLTLPGIFG
jgi:hypothetical protein